jgi:hypothetical protein
MVSYQENSPTAKALLLAQASLSHAPYGILLEDRWRRRVQGC